MLQLAKSFVGFVASWKSMATGCRQPPSAAAAVARHQSCFCCVVLFLNSLSHSSMHNQAASTMSPVIYYMLQFDQHLCHTLIGLIKPLGVAGVSSLQSLAWQLLSRVSLGS